LTAGAGEAAREHGSLPFPGGEHVFLIDKGGENDDAEARDAIK
jgi:hypothetical protein